MFKGILLLSICFFVAGTARTSDGGADVFREGVFAVRKVDGGCKLETNLLAKEQKPPAKGAPEEVMGILALFASDKYYSELFTNRKKVGQAQKMVHVGFDKDKAVAYPFAAKPGSDEHWRWQYLENTKGLLDGIANKQTMKLEFSNGKNSFHFDVDLKEGGAKAVAAIKKCNGEKVEQEPAKKEPVKGETAKKESVKKEHVKKEHVKKEHVKKEPIKKEHVKKEPVKKVSAKKVTAKKVTAKKTSHKKDPGE